jgi:hypothetical protein
MSNVLVHVGRVIHAVVREKAKDRLRSPKWAGVRKKHLVANPACAACGSKRFLQVHHMVPFSDRPELELDFTNLITLCMSRNECHLHIGHGGGYKFFNPSVIPHSALMKLDPKQVKRIWVLAKTARRDKPETTPS